MSSKFIERSPKKEDALILIMDEDGNVTTDPAHFQRIVQTGQLPDMNIKLVRMEKSESVDKASDSDEEAQLKLTVEDMYRNSTSSQQQLQPGAVGSTVLLTETQPTTSTTANSSEFPTHDMVDPFSQMDPEQLERLEHALASEQAKHILGENVAAMLDILSVEDPALLVHNSIKNDHCYTNLQPNADPSTSRSSEIAKMATGSKASVSGPTPSGSGLGVARRGAFTLRQYKNKSALIRGGRGGGGISVVVRSKEEPQDPSFDSEDVDVEEESDASVGADGEDEHPSDEDYAERPARRKEGWRGRGRGRRGWRGGRGRGRGARTSVGLDDEMSKILQSMEGDGGGADLKKKERKPRGRGRGAGSLVVAGVERRRTLSGSAPRSVEEPKPQPVEKVTTTPGPVSPGGGAKYPKRENRKPPAHLKESLGPALFSTPDIIRRISTGDETPTTPSEKKNFTVGVQKVPSQTTPTAPKAQKTMISFLTKKAIPVKTGQSLLKPTAAVTEERQPAVAAPAPAPPTAAAASVVAPAPTVVQPAPRPAVVVQQEPIRPRLSLDKSGIYLGMEATDTEFLLDPSQMDQSLLASVGSSVYQHEEVTSQPSTPVAGPSTSAKLVDSTSDSAEKKRNAVKRRRSDEVSDLESDLDDALSEASWNSEDDPDRLWCICRKPHNNRFMICCDACTEWFHGKCVGITKAIGKQMEQDGLEWTCPKCSTAKCGGAAAVAVAAPSATQDTLKQTTMSDFLQKGGGRKCIMCKGPVRENSIYCSDDCILKHSQRAISQLSDTPKADSVATSSAALTSGTSAVVVKPAQKVFVIPKVVKPSQQNTYRILSMKDGRKVVLDAKAMAAQPRKLPVTKGPQQQQQQQSPQVAVQSTLKRIKPIQGQTKLPKVFKIITPQGSTLLARNKTEVIDALPMTLKTAKVVEKPRAEVITLPKVVTPKPTKVVTVSPQQQQLPQPVRRRRKDLDMSSVKTEAKKEHAEQQIRESVKKTLAETLKARVAECKEMTVNEGHIDTLVVKIEERLFKQFENKVDAKYKSKYRSLIFNIKDPKNETLFRKIADSSISPKELVKLSPEEMASQELAQWREKENQHQLEMIKKTELELMTIGSTYIMKSHKGEQMIENGPAEKVAAVAAEIDPNTPAQELVSALNSVSSTTHEVKSKGRGRPKKGHEKDRHKRSSGSDKDRKHKREKERKRSRSRSRTRSHKTKRKRSRSRSRERSKTKTQSRSREKESVKEKELQEDERKAVEALEQLSKPVETQEVFDPADHEPSSTVTIQTPPEEMHSAVEEDTAALPPSPAEDDPEAPLWSGHIIMADVARFCGVARYVNGDATHLDRDLLDKLDVVGRIPYNTVWEYLARVKRLDSKDIVCVAIDPSLDVDEIPHQSLYSYLAGRARIGVMGKIKESIKDMYLYPISRGATPPQVLHPLPDSLFPPDKNHTLLGIVVRSKPAGRLPARSVPTALAKTLAKKEAASNPPARSFTPPLPSTDSDKREKGKRKIRVHVEHIQPKKAPVVEEQDDDSPYSPASSEEDLPPLSKKVSRPQPQAALDIQKKLEVVNRAIEEQAQQIQNLAGGVPFAAVPLLAAAAVLPLPRIPDIITKLSPPLPAKLAPPVVTLDSDEPKEEKIPFLQEVDKISIPSNLQEILASIQKKTDEPEVKDNVTLLSRLTDEELIRKAQEMEEESLKSARDEAVTEKVESQEEVIEEAKEEINTKEEEEEEVKSESGEEPMVLEQNTDQADAVTEKPELTVQVEETEAGNSAQDEGGFTPPGRPPTPPPPPISLTPPPPPSISSAPEPCEPVFEGIPLNIPPPPERRPKLDTKSVFENEGVPDFKPDEVKKPINFKIGLKLKRDNFAPKSQADIDMNHFDIESFSTIGKMGVMSKDIDERRLPSSSKPAPSVATQPQAKADVDERFDLKGKLDTDERVADKVAKHKLDTDERFRVVGKDERAKSKEKSRFDRDERSKSPESNRHERDDRSKSTEKSRHERDERKERNKYPRDDRSRSNDKDDRHWKSERIGSKRRSDERRHFEGDTRRHGEYKRRRRDEDRLEEEWEGSIKDFEERQRRKKMDDRRSSGGNKRR